MSAKAESPLKKVMAENQQFKSAVSSGMSTLLWAATEFRIAAFQVDKAIAEAKKIKPKDGAIKLEASRTK